MRTSPAIMKMLQKELIDPTEPVAFDARDF